MSLCIGLSGCSLHGVVTATRGDLDYERLSLGKAVFLESPSVVEPAPPRHAAWALPEEEVGADATFEQWLRLMELQGQLATAETADVQLVELAGKITADELEALKYHLYSRKVLPEDFDAGQYATGDQVFHRRLELPGRDDATAEAQTARLEEIEAKLTRQDQQTANLRDLAGRLDADQIDALDYFVATRYKLVVDLDGSKYLLGEHVLHGQHGGNPGSPEHTFLQERVLARTQERMPRRVQRRFDLRRLAGRIDGDQLDALLYFVEMSFGVDTAGLYAADLASESAQ